MTTTVPAADLARWVSERARGHDRYLFGLAGPPGSGKSTLAGRLAERLNAPLVPMDGFHLPDVVLGQRDLRSIKGAPKTFDADGFVDAIRRLRTGADVSVPTFDRVTDEPVPDSLHVDGSAPIVIVEGNYLLLGTPPWDELVSLFDDIGHLQLDPRERIDRLIERHIEHGKQPDDARRFVAESDEANTAVIDAYRHRADLIVAGT